MKEVFHLTYQDHIMETQVREVKDAVEDSKHHALNYILLIDFGTDVEVHADPLIPISKHIENLESALQAMREWDRG